MSGGQPSLSVRRVGRGRRSKGVLSCLLRTELKTFGRHTRSYADLVVPVISRAERSSSVRSSLSSNSLSTEPPSRRACPIKPPVKQAGRSTPLVHIGTRIICSSAKIRRN